MSLRAERSCAFVEWLDSTAPDGWVAIGRDTNNPPMTCYSMGWILHESEDAIVITGSIGFDGGEASCANAPMTIPKLAIRRREEIRSQGEW